MSTPTIQARAVTETGCPFCGEPQGSPCTWSPRKGVRLPLEYPHARRLQIVRQADRLRTVSVTLSPAEWQTVRQALTDRAALLHAAGRGVEMVPVRAVVATIEDQVAARIEADQ